MSYLLHIDTSIRDTDSVSRQVARSFRELWNGEVVHRDLGAAPIPHLDAVGFSARETDAARHTAGQAAAAALQDEFVEEFLGASAYLFTLPLYNYAMPSVFKAWLDQIMVPGRTMGPGTVPAAGRPALVISARGGGYGPGTPQYGMDQLVPVVEALLGDPRSLALDVSTLTPELTLAPVIPAMTTLIPLHEASLAEAHERARRIAEKFNEQHVA
jgi:FMN-dependent NADH-azoreductase